jgi:hypothetical protein
MVGIPPNSSLKFICKPESHITPNFLFFVFFSYIDLVFLLLKTICNRDSMKQIFVNDTALPTAVLQDVQLNFAESVRWQLG